MDGFIFDLVSLSALPNQGLVSAKETRGLVPYRHLSKAITVKATSGGRLIAFRSRKVDAHPFLYFVSADGQLTDPLQNSESFDLVSEEFGVHGDAERILLALAIGLEGGWWKYGSRPVEYDKEQFPHNVGDAEWLRAGHHLWWQPIGGNLYHTWIENGVPKVHLIKIKYGSYQTPRLLSRLAFLKRGL